MSELILKSTSSGINGWSTLSEYLDCGARAEAARKAKLIGPSEYMPFPEVDGDPVNTTVGSIYGELCQRWLRGDPVRPATQLFWQAGDEVLDLQKSHPATVALSWVLYEKYTQKYDAKHWGEIVGCEVPITIPGSLFGLEFDLTGNVDLLVRNERGLGVVDLKTEGRNDKNLYMKFSLRAQKWIYALGVELSTDFGKPNFCAIDLCIKNKEPKFDKFYYDAMTDRRFAWLRAEIEYVKAQMANPVPRPNIAFCHKYNRPCEFFVDQGCSLVSL